MRTTILAVGAGILLLIGSATLYTRFNHRTQYVQHATVVLTERGFEPNEVYLAQGGSITFSTQLGVPFWPASNAHPTHYIYQEFDPRRPLDPTEVWTFQFNRIGDWGFHDHIRSYFIGTIHVGK